MPSMTLRPTHRIVEHYVEINYPSKAVHINESRDAVTFEYDKTPPIGYGVTPSEMRSFGDAMVPDGYIVNVQGVDDAPRHYIVKIAVPVTTWYIVVYEVGSVYGGPEEGGWWYDVGDAIDVRTVEADTPDEALRLRDEAMAELHKRYRDDGKRFSVLPDPDYQLRRFATFDDIRWSFPETRPRYE